MKLLLLCLLTPLVLLLLFYFLFPVQLVAFGRWLLRKRGRTMLKSVTIDGRAWPYLEGGDPNKPTLLLVHGFSGDKDNWSMMAPYLTRDYHIISPDLPGFGENERTTEIPFDILSQTRRLKAFSDALGLQRPHIVGNSMGGWIALRYALEYPDAIHGLVLIDNAGVLGSDESLLQKLAANRDYNPLILANLEDADRLIAMVAHRSVQIPARLKPVFYADALKYREQLDHAFWVIANEALDQPLNDRLTEVRAPTLILWGRHDQIVDVSCVSALEAGIAGSRSHIFEHLGHVPMVEDPRATASEIKRFIAALR